MALLSAANTSALADANYNLVAGSNGTAEAKRYLAVTAADSIRFVVTGDLGTPGQAAAEAVYQKTLAQIAYDYNVAAADATLGGTTVADTRTADIATVETAYKTAVVRATGAARDKLADASLAYAAAVNGVPLLTGNCPRPATLDNHREGQPNPTR